MNRSFGLVSLFILLLALNVWSNHSPPTIRQTSNGPVEGLEKISSLGQKYYSFRGIPYAEPPITGIDPYTGEHVEPRFRAPAPLKRRWTKALKAHKFGKTCTQPKVDGGIPVEQSQMGEDCLNLNVYVPASGSKYKTVLVWFYGGGFNVGDATDNLYGPDFLISQDNIVVTINYRLSIFGFLNLNFGEYTGNMGLKDQQLALKWIRENIEHFSGNKSEVLIFGQSAGSASVHLHILNDESHKYFQRAYADSGSAFQPYVITKTDHVQHLQDCLNITGMDQLIERLNMENSIKLMNCSTNEAPNPFNIIWAPVVENSNAKNPFLTKTIEDIYNGMALAMDVLFSFTAQEIPLTALNISSSEASKPLIKQNVMETTKFELPFKGFTKTSHPKEYAEALKKLRKAYFSNLTSIHEIKRANADLLSDSMLNYQSIKSIRFQAKANQNSTNGSGRKNTFLFRFNVTADLNLANISSEIKFSDAAHTDDICYMFHCHYLDRMKKYDKHLKQKDFNYELIMRSVKMITNFARTGDPSIEGHTPFRSINSIDELYCQEVANDLKTNVTYDILEQKHFEVWNEIEEIYKNINL